MANFLVARTAAAFTSDPRIFLKDHIKLNWTATPAVAAIGFDTKWSSLNLSNYIIVERDTTDVEFTVLGASRSNFVETYKVSVYARAPPGDTALNNRFAMEQEITRIINGDADSIQTVNSVATGIDWAWIDSFRDVPVFADQITKGIAPSEPSVVARSVATIKINYEKVAS